MSEEEEFLDRIEHLRNEERKDAVSLQYMRAQFAAMAMQGLVSTGMAKDSSGDFIAEVSVVLADALIKELKK